MTSEVTLTSGSTSVTIFSVVVEEILSKNLILLSFPQTKQNQDSGPKANKAMDLLRQTRRLNITGHITPTDRQNFYTLFKKGGVFTLSYIPINKEKGNLGVGFNVNIEKAIIIEKGDGEGSERLNDSNLGEPQHYEFRGTFVITEDL